MTTTLMSPPRVVWSEGLPLAPQHFQLQDRYHEAQLDGRLGALTPHAWGAVRVELDRRALARGELRVVRFEGVLPDGTLLALGPDSPELPPARPVDAAALDARGSLDVLIALPREREGGPGIASGSSGARHRLLTRTAADAYGEAEPISVGLAARAVRLVQGAEPREDLAVIKLAEVRRDAAGGFVLDETWIAPTPRIGSSEALVASMAQLVSRLRERRGALLRARRERDAETIEFDSTDVTRFLLLYAIGAQLPVLEHLHAQPDASPRELFARLLSLAGGLASFAAEAELEVPAYDHLDLRGTFAPLFARLERLLAASSREHCFEVPLEVREDGLHFATLDERVAKCERFLLAVRSDVTEAEIARLVPALGKVASWEDVPALVASATPGAALEIAHRPPPEVAIKAGETYFALGQGRHLTSALRDGRLAVFLPRPFEPASTRVTLLAIPARAARVATPGAVRAA